jgi:hypothetical protein
VAVAGRAAGRIRATLAGGERGHAAGDEGAVLLLGQGGAPVGGGLQVRGRLVMGVIVRPDQAGSTRSALSVFSPSLRLRPGPIPEARP